MRKPTLEKEKGGRKTQRVGGFRSGSWKRGGKEHLSSAFVEGGDALLG